MVRVAAMEEPILAPPSKCFDHPEFRRHSGSTCLVGCVFAGTLRSEDEQIFLAVELDG
jgi:hypothetical protein